MKKKLIKPPVYFTKSLVMPPNSNGRTISLSSLALKTKAYCTVYSCIQIKVKNTNNGSVSVNSTQLMKAGGGGGWAGCNCVCVSVCKSTLPSNL